MATKEKVVNLVAKIGGWLDMRIREKTRNVGFSCDFCKKEILDYPDRRICDACAAMIKENDGRKCPKCGRRTVAEGLCLACKSSAPAFDEGISSILYDRFSAGMINRLKNGNRYLRYYFGELLLSALFSTMGASSVEELREKAIKKWGEDFFLVPVPMMKYAVRERGYNQAEELAKELSALTGFLCRTDILKKVRPTLPQKNLTSKERRENVRGAYRVKARVACREKVILLIDDVMTTSSTGSECARVLKNAGAKKVVFLTIAALEEKRKLSVKKINPS